MNDEVPVLLGDIKYDVKIKYIKRIYPITLNKEYGVEFHRGYELDDYEVRIECETVEKLVPKYAYIMDKQILDEYYKENALCEWLSN